MSKGRIKQDELRSGCGDTGSVIALKIFEALIENRILLWREFLIFNRYGMTNQLLSFCER